MSFVAEARVDEDLRPRRREARARFRCRTRPAGMLAGGSASCSALGSALRADGSVLRNASNRLLGKLLSGDLWQARFERNSHQIPITFRVEVETGSHLTAAQSAA